MSTAEGWRERVKPTLKGPWQMVRMSLEKRGYTLQVWKDVTLANMDPVEVWAAGRDLAVLMRRDGERVGLARLP